MLNYTLKAFVSDEVVSAKNSKWDKALLDATIASRKPVGPMLVTVVRSEENDGYVMSGDAVIAEPSDLVDSTEINAKLGEILGTIRAIREDDPAAEFHKTGGPVNLLYALNHGGLPLLCNKAICAEFQKSTGGRVTPAEQAAAFSWVLQQPNKDALLAQVASFGMAPIIEAFRNRPQ